MKSKIAVFAGDLFWSSTPYECLNVYYELKDKGLNVDYIMFNNDIRLNKIFEGCEKFFFKREFFQSCENIKIINSWKDFFSISKDYDFVLSRCKMVPKTRPVNNFKNNFKSKLVFWDVGGADILHKNDNKYADYYITKSPLWETIIHKQGVNKNNTFNACPPQYSYYYRKDIKYNDYLNYDNFSRKYQIEKNNKILLVLPSNPGSHKNQFEKNFEILSKIIKDSKRFGFEVLLKTYPHDYLFYEKEIPMSGIYKRMYKNNLPQYMFLKKLFPSIKIVDSQDHYSALTHSDKIFNMSGSHVAWETFYTKSISYSANYKNQKYFSGVNWLPEDVYFPDDIFNIEINNSEEVFAKVNKEKFKKDKKQFSEMFSNKKISDVMIEMLRKIKND